MAVMQGMLKTLCGVQLAAAAAWLLAGASASASREHVHGTQRVDLRHRLPVLSGKSVMEDLLLQGKQGCSSQFQKPCGRRSYAVSAAID